MRFFLIALLSVLFAALQASAQQPEPGKAHFDALCAACHGSDGGGGEFGPNIVDMRRRTVISATPEGLRAVIRNGIPDSGMPGFPLPDNELDQLVAFIAALRAPAADRPSAGDVQAGGRFFSGKGGCSECHMVHGRGGLLGPGLTNLARERRLAQIEQALRDPDSLRTPGYTVVSVRLSDGRTLRGLAKNESNYDLQLQAIDGVLHLLSRDQVITQTRETKSLMPPLKATDNEKRDLLAFLSRLTVDVKPSSQTSGAPRPEAGIPFADIVKPKLGDWPTYHGHLSGNRYSPLKEIDATNVARLAPKWVFPISNARRLEVTPVVVGGVMYVTTANEAFALDARNGRQIWHYARPLTKGVVGDAGANINRGVAVLGDLVFMVTDHAHLIALHRLTGELVWDTEMADYREHYGATSAPLVVRDLVLSGTSGGDEGARGFVDAYRAATGERVWRFWTMPKPGEPLSETWQGRAIEHGCAAAWLTGTYDPESDLVYWPTGNPCPDYNGDERKGDNLYSASVLALEASSGKLRWYFQYTPHDLHDWDAAQTPMLVDTEFQGRPRKLLVQANRNGYFYVLDRITGQFLLGQPFIHKLTWASGIGPDGRPQVLPDSDPTAQGTRVCPSVVGATNWMSTAFDPEARLFYVMALESCGIYTKSAAWWEPGKSFYGGSTRRIPGESGEKFLRAIDPQTGRIAWEIPQLGPGNTWGGVMATAAGLVFFMDDSGALAAADAVSGKTLWHFHTNHSWHASPMTYAIDGKQYVAFAAGMYIMALALP